MCAMFAVFSLFAAVVLWSQGPVERMCGHVRSAPWMSTAGRRPYVQLRQEVRAAGAVASDGDLAAHSQIVGSEESTEARSRMTAVFNRCDVGRMVAAAAATQRQQASALQHWLCLGDRREVLLVVRRYRLASSSAFLFVVISFVVAVATYSSSSPSLFVACYYYLCVAMCIIVASRFHSLSYFNLWFCCSVCLSRTHSFSS
jgi:hypothetical protein